MKNIALMLALTLGLLLGVEILVRVAVKPTPQTFFIAGKTPGSFVSNQKVFNPLGNFSVNDLELQKKKPAGVYRIFTIGESTTAGLHFNPYATIAKFLELQIHDALPEVKIEVVNAGTGGKGSDDVRKIFQECLDFEPDLFIVYLGQNDFLEPNVMRFREQRLHPGRLALMQALSRSATFRWLQSKAMESAAKRPRAPIYEKDMIAENYVGEELVPIIHDFENNLRLIGKQAHDRKIPLIFMTPFSNIRDWEPNVSYFSRVVSREQKEEFERSILQAKQQIADDKLPQAAASLEEAAAIDPQVAELYWWQAKLFEKQGNWKGARRAYDLAATTDGRPYRNFPEFADLTQNIAKEEGVLFYDSNAELRALSPNGLIGFNVIIDNCHPTLEGQHRLATGLVDLMAENNFLAPADRWRLKQRKSFDTDLARLSLTAAQRAETHYRTANYVLSWAGLRYDPRARAERALYEYDEAIKSKPEYPEALYAGALALEVLGRSLEAKTRKDIARKIDRDIDKKMKLMSELLHPLTRPAVVNSVGTR